MVCCILSCPNRLSRSCRSYPIPEINYVSATTTRLSKKRRKAWKNALRQSNPNTKIPDNPRVCYHHFIKEHPARLIDEDDPDWVPTQNLVYGAKRIREKRKCLKNRNSFNEESLEIDENETLGGDGDPDDFDEPNLEFMPVASGSGVQVLATNRGPVATTTNGLDSAAQIGSGSVSQQSKIDLKLLKLEIELKHRDELIQDHLQNEKEIALKYKKIIDSHQERLREQAQEIKYLKQTIRAHDISFDALKTDDQKVKNLTGLPNFTVLNKLFEVIKDDLTEKTSKTKFNKFDSFLITLMKLRLDLPISYLSFVFSETEMKMSKMYRESLYTMNERIGPLVQWPDEEALLLSTPDSFKEIMGNKCIVLINFFDMLIKNIKNSTNIKHKLRYLIAFTASGEIIYVSKGFGSSASNEHVIEQSGFLDNLSEQHVVLSVKDLFDESLKNNEQIQKIKHLAKKIEDKMLDLLKENFRILFNRQAVDTNKEVYSEFTVRCCCALANLLMPESLEPSTLEGEEKEEATVVVHTTQATSEDDDGNDSSIDMIS